MTARRLLPLSVAAIVVIAVALWLANRTPSPFSHEIDAPLYSTLREEVNSVDAVRIFAAGNAQAVELQRSASGWSVTEQSGYAADEGKIRQLLLALTQAKLVEEKTANPNNYPALGVEDVSAAQATGVRVELGGTRQPFELIVGKHGPGAQSTYVRRANEATSWLINTSLDVPADPQSWLDRSIVNLSADRIQSAEIALRGGRYIAAKSSRADADFKVENLPRGKELSSPAAANSLATALANLTLDGVQPAEQFEDGTPAAQASFKTFDGLVADLQGWTRDDTHYIALNISFDEDLAQRFHLPAAAPEAGNGRENDPENEGAAASEESSQDVQEAREEAEALDAKVGGWVYEIPQYKYEAIFKPLEDLLKS